MDVYKAVKRDIVAICIAYIVIVMGWRYLPLNKDATDPVWGRSGVNLRIDNETGLHYLESHSGYLMPRLSAEGQQIRDFR